MRQAVPGGKAVIKFDFAYDGGRSKGGEGTIYVNGQKAAEGRIEHTHANIFSADDAADVGIDEGTPVTDAYNERQNKFTGKIEKVTIDLKEMKPAEKAAIESSRIIAAQKNALAD